MTVIGPADAVANFKTLGGEGPVWEPSLQRLLWVDIPRRQVLSLQPTTGESALWQFDHAISAICPTGDGRYVAATSLGIAELCLDPPGLNPLESLPSGDRMNDAKADPGGRLVGGTYTEERIPGACALYRFDRRGTVVTLVGAVTVANGLGWSPDSRLMYFNDTSTECVDVFTYDKDTGEVSNRRCFADLSGAPGRPDGLTVDEDGCLWVAMVRGGRILRLDPRGNLDLTVELPVSFVTSCTFGGPELSDLYVTTGRPGPAEPLAGALFRLPTRVRGLPWTPCRFLEDERA